jgi:hypothetical protein
MFLLPLLAEQARRRNLWCNAALSVESVFAHNFIRLETFTGWMDIDATWPLNTQRLGMPVNEEFEMGVNMRIACEPVEIFAVPKSTDPQAFKEKLVQEFCGTKVESRDGFIETLSAWLDLSQNTDTESI